MGRQTLLLRLQSVLIKHRDHMRDLPSMTADQASELEKVEAAVERCEAGQYGVCEVCGTAIPLSRLTVLPYATKCVRCQRQAEFATED